VPYIPSNPTVHFDDVSTSAPTPTHSDLPRPSYYDGNGVTSTMPPELSYFLYEDPLAQNIIDPESQSLGHRSEIGPDLTTPSIPVNTTTPHANMYHQQFNVGCQTQFDPPSMEVSEKKN
jgi:hypothetical protein